MATKIKELRASHTIKALSKRFEKINFDLAIQRNEVWDEARKSLLIHSLLYGYPVSSVSTRKLDNSDIDHVLDGKQRLTTIYSFIKQGEHVKDSDGNKIPLLNEANEQMKDEKGTLLYKTYPGFELKGVPEVTYIDEDNGDAEITIDVNGMRFLDLPEALRDDLMGRQIGFHRFENMTDEEQDEMFFRTNNGVALRNMELTRAHAGSQLMDFIEKLAAKPFWSVSAAITDKARDRFTDDESVLQVLALVYYYGTDKVPGFGGDDMKKFVGLLREQGGFPEDKAAVVDEVADYLGLAFPYKENSLKKVHIPSLFYVAIRAKQLGITPEKFGGYWQGFWDNRYQVGTTYGVAASGGSAKPEKVALRVNEMMKDFEKHINDAPNYTEPKKVQNAKAKAAEVARAAEDAIRLAHAEAEQVLRDKAAAQSERNDRVLDGGEKVNDDNLVKA